MMSLPLVKAFDGALSVLSFHLNPFKTNHAFILPKLPPINQPLNGVH